MCWDGCKDRSFATGMLVYVGGCGGASLQPRCFSAMASASSWVLVYDPSQGQDLNAAVVEAVSGGRTSRCGAEGESSVSHRGHDEEWPPDGALSSPLQAGITAKVSVCGV